MVSNELLNEEERQQIINSLMAIVFSHRHTKGDRFIKEALSKGASSDTTMDFTIVRDVMYKYSKLAQDRYFSNPIESFFFASFALCDEGVEYLKSKPDNHEDAQKLMKMMKVLVDLRDQAVNSLKDLKMDYLSNMKENEQQVMKLKQNRISNYLFNELRRMTRGKI